MKKKLSIVASLVLCMVMAAPNFVYAASGNKSEISFADTESFNEIEYLLEIKELTDQELKTIGFSENEIKELSDFSIEEEYLERKNLPYEILVAYGYNDEQIEIIQNYDGSPITINSPMMKVASSMAVSEFEPYMASTDGFEVEYVWEWNIVPVFKSTDKVVVYWDAHNMEGGDVDIKANKSNCYADVMYYNMTNGKRASSQDETVYAKYSSTYDAVSADIEMVKGDNYYWAKKGVFHVDVTKNLSSSADIGDIDFGAGYGHRTMHVTSSITYTIGEKFILSFQPKLSTDKVTNISCNYTYRGKLENNGEF